MAGVMIPVIVALWNDRRGKVLRIGSVVLLQGVLRRAAWSARLTELWLLVVRGLMLIFLAGLLTAPVWVRTASGDRRGWVLIAGNDRRADSLVHAGWERHEMDSVGNYWDEFRQLDRVAPVGAAFFVFTPGLANRFAGERPVTSRKVDWKVYTPEDSVRRWVEAVSRVSGDSIMVVRGSSSATGTEFRREKMAFLGGVFEGVRVDTSAIPVDVGSNEYLSAAVKALSAYTGRRMVSGGGRIVVWGRDWEAAAWDGRLPVVLGEQLFGFSTSGNDRRVVDASQVAPVRVGGSALAGEEAVDLRPMVWGIVFFLFLLERIMVYRRDKA
jgi:hypothetical protein